MHREMEAMVKAGLTPFQVLQAATRNAAEFLNATREWGTIEAGKRADLDAMIVRARNAIDGAARTN
jgi:imidazolonepropionase-like amidohydrolase